jgi:hypothetical protein
VSTGTILFLTLGVALAATQPVAGQPLKVYSEFARIDAQGKPVAPANPREILSPAVARNAFTSFQVVVEVPDGTPWQLYIAQNPEDAVQVTLYREAGEQLQPVSQPAAGNNTQIFWMDVWAGRGDAVQRIKVEPQLRVNNDWVIYPMEVRVVAATVPGGERPAGTAPPGEVMRGFLCGTKAEGPPPESGPTVAGMRFRNAQQDRALAALAAREELQKKFGACDAQPPDDNPEWYYPVRDFLYRLP